MSRSRTAWTGAVLAVGVVGGLLPGQAFAATAPGLKVIAKGLDNPRGLTVLREGTVLVAEAGKGGTTCSGQGEQRVCFGRTAAITMVRHGRQQRVVRGLPSAAVREGEVVGPHDVAVGPRGGLYTVFGLGGTAADRAAAGPAWSRFGTVERLAPARRRVADLTAYEARHDPDKYDPSTQGKDSNPFSLVPTRDGGMVATDAGGNDLLRIGPGGRISTLAVLPSQCVPAPPGPPPAPSCPKGRMRQQPVPTGVVRGPDGAFYVGELSGFPFTKGTSRVWRITPDGHESVVARGLTNVIDLAFDRRGRLYVLEIAKNGLGSGDLTGALIRIGPRGHQVTVASRGMVAPTGLAIGPGGAYVSNHGLIPGAGEVVKIRL